MIAQSPAYHDHPSRRLLLNFPDTTASLGLSLLGLFVLPVLVRGSLGDGRGGVRWYEACRDPTGLAPHPATTREAVIQVYAARAVSWRGVFSVHTWFAVKPTGAERFTRYELLGFGVANGTPAVRVNRTGPANYWFGARPQIILDRRGPGVDVMIEAIRAAVARYPDRKRLALLEAAALQAAFEPTHPLDGAGAYRPDNLLS